MKAIALYKGMPEWATNLVLVLMATMLMFSLSGCGAAGPAIADLQVLTIRGTTVAYGIQRALNGCPGAQVFQNLNNINQYMFIWTAQDSKAAMFWGADMKYMQPMDVVDMLKQGGGMASLKTISGLKDFMLDHGWVPISAAEVPMALKVAANLLTAGATIKMPLLILPGGMFNGVQDFFPDPVQT